MGVTETAVAGGVDTCRTSSAVVTEAFAGIVPSPKRIPLNCFAATELSPVIASVGPSCATLAADWLMNVSVISLVISRVRVTGEAASARRAPGPGSVASERSKAPASMTAAPAAISRLDRATSTLRSPLPRARESGKGLGVRASTGRRLYSAFGMPSPRCRRRRRPAAWSPAHRSGPPR